MNPKLVCVVGSLNEDTGLRVAHLPLPGETVLADGRSIAPGGKGANQAAAAAAVGGRVAMVGAVGADEAGDRSVSALQRLGVDVSGIRRDQARPTGIAIVVVDESSENHIVVAAGANVGLQAVDAVQSVRNLGAGLVLMQLEIPLAVASAVARESDGIVVLNPAPMPQDPSPVLAMLGDVDVLVPNRAELGRLTRRSEPRNLAEVAECVAVLGFSGSVVVTMGADGAYCFEAGREPVHVPAEPVMAIDTSGAGDMFCGCLAVRLAASDSLIDAVRMANRIAAQSTTVAGAQVDGSFSAQG